MLIKRLTKLVCSLWLTVICLALGMVLVFVGTMAQVKLGLYEVQEIYFRSWIVFWEPGDSGVRIPVLPGGWTIGAVLLINLLSAHVKRFRMTWKKSGIVMVHAGLILLLVGQFATETGQIESFMKLHEGEAKNYSEDNRANELVIIDKSDPDHDKVVAIPSTLLEEGKALSHPALPFTLQVKEYFVNSEPQFRPGQGNGVRGVGSVLSFIEQPKTTRMDARDIPAALVEISGEGGGTWWVSNWIHEEKLQSGLLSQIRQFVEQGSMSRQAAGSLSQALAQPQAFQEGGRTYELSLRATRYYKPHFIRLIEFTHERYPGTEIPKDFASEVQVTREDTHEDRPVRIYMNNPLRYGGETYYQAGYEGEDVTILQVVRNPSWLIPYISCIIVLAGLLVQFLIHLVGFVAKRRKV